MYVLHHQCNNLHKTLYYFCSICTTDQQKFFHSALSRVRIFLTTVTNPKISASDFNADHKWKKYIYMQNWTHTQPHFEEMYTLNQLGLIKNCSSKNEGVLWATGLWSSTWESFITELFYVDFFYILFCILGILHNRFQSNPN